LILWNKEPYMTELEIQKLMDCAIKARENAYSPYSHFAVGAALLCEDGTLYEGCNIENASYGLTNCAERTAIFKAVSEGHIKFKALAVVGACRQVVAEFKIPIIIMGNLMGNVKIVTIEELLPFSFSESELIGK